MLGKFPVNKNRKEIFFSLYQSFELLQEFWGNKKAT
jgi:hypothetical protein